MPRTVPDVLRRGFDSAFANWQLLLLRVAENILFGVLIIASVIAAVVPLLVSIGLSAFNADRPEESAGAIAGSLIEHLSIFVWIFAGALVLALLLMLIHSFVMAGCAQTFVDAERAGGAGLAPRPRLRMFNMDRWLSGARHSTWTVFWVYNIAYGSALAIVLIPLAITLAGVLTFRDSKGAVLAIGCLGLAISIFLIIVASVVAAVWSQKAIVVAVERNLSAAEATREARSELRADFGRHFAVAFILFVIGFGGAATLGMFTVLFAVPSAHDSYMQLAFAPARLVISMMQGTFSAAVGLWMLASFAALSDSKQVR
jgi:hypothetical protein